jgi:hypothetical protein
VKTFTKESLKAELLEISNRGYIPSHKDTSSRRNDGAAGNLLENLLGIEENNLPLPNANEWELKVQRFQTSSLMTLFHMEPSPRALKFVPQVLLPIYGWPHDQAGKTHGENERSFRMTMNGGTRTNRGFKVIADTEVLKISFDSKSVDPQHSSWLKEIESKVGLNDLDPFPYWGLEDLRKKVAAKLQNAFYITADVKKDSEGQEHFHFGKCEILSGFSLDGFIECLNEGSAFVEFDARTGHNHGTKFRIKQSSIPRLYSSHELVFDKIGKFSKPS